MKMARMTSHSPKDDAPAPANTVGSGLQEIDTPDLSVHLSEEHIRRLGLDKMPRVGDRIGLKAHARVTSVSSHNDGKGKPRRSMSLTVEHMGASKGAPTSAVDAVEDGIDSANGSAKR
jgi:hypothetical protein